MKFSRSAAGSTKPGVSCGVHGAGPRPSSDSSGPKSLPGRKRSRTGRGPGPLMMKTGISDHVHGQEGLDSEGVKQDTYSVREQDITRSKAIIRALGIQFPLAWKTHPSHSCWGKTLRCTKAFRLSPRGVHGHGLKGRGTRGETRGGQTQAVERESRDPGRSQRGSGHLSVTTTWRDLGRDWVPPWLAVHIQGNKELEI